MIIIIMQSEDLSRLADERKKPTGDYGSLGHVTLQYF